MDILWIIVMKSVWAGKPAKNVENWRFFDNIRGITMFLSYVNIAIKVSAVLLLVYIFRASKTSQPVSAMH
jgi:hypothetical protein